MSRIILLILITFLSTTTFSQQHELMKIKEDSAAIRLERVNINVEIIGNVATTVTELTFYNPNDRILEGELNFPLVENQRVYRFALDINGKLREGVAVEKSLGRRAFEGVVRQNIDPALLEMTAGNNYKARVYPIPANGRRRVVLGYEEELQYGDQPLYQLALNYGKVDDFQIKVSVVNQAFKPIIKRDDLVNLEFNKWNEAYVAEQELSDFHASGILSFEIPVNLKETVFREKGKDQDFVYLTMRPNAKTGQKALPTKISVYWDVSNSSKNRDINKELEMLRLYLSKFQELEVILIQFSDAIIGSDKYSLEKGNPDEIISKIKNFIYDGGTNLSAIEFNKFESDEYFLFSDGITNLGELKLDENANIINTICSSKISDLSLLKFTANETGGRFINLLNTSIEDGCELLLSTSFEYLGATYNDKKISEVYPASRTAIKPNATFTLAARIKTNKKGTLKLNFGVGDQVMETKEVPIDNALINSPISRFWAHKKVDHLVAMSSENREQIIEVGKSYGTTIRKLHNLKSPYL